MLLQFLSVPLLLFISTISSAARLQPRYISPGNRDLRVRDASVSSPRLRRSAYAHGQAGYHSDIYVRDADAYHSGLGYVSDFAGLHRRNIVARAHQSTMQPAHSTTGGQTQLVQDKKLVAIMTALFEQIEKEPKSAPHSQPKKPFTCLPSIESVLGISGPPAVGSTQEQQKTIHHRSERLTRRKTLVGDEIKAVFDLDTTEKTETFSGKRIFWMVPSAKGLVYRNTGVALGSRGFCGCMGIMLLSKLVGVQVHVMETRPTSANGQWWTAPESEKKAKRDEVVGDLNLQLDIGFNSGAVAEQVKKPEAELEAIIMAPKMDPTYQKHLDKGYIAGYFYPDQVDAVKAALKVRFPNINIKEKPYLPRMGSDTAAFGVGARDIMLSQLDIDDSTGKRVIKTYVDGGLVHTKSIE